MELKRHRNNSRHNRPGEPDEQQSSLSAVSKRSPLYSLQFAMAEAQQRREFTEQHGPCYRIDPKTGERTVIE